MKRAMKIFSRMFLFVMIAAIAAMMFFIYQAKGNIEKMPAFFGYKPLTILSNSMKPAFSAGDVILINVSREPKVNEIATYKHPQGMLVTHRIKAIIHKSGKTYYQFKGDNNNTADDALVPKSSIIGVETVIIPNGGYIAKFVSGPIGFFLFIAVPLLTLAIIEIFQRMGIIPNKETTNT